MKKETNKIYNPFSPVKKVKHVEVEGFRLLVKGDYSEWVYTKELPDLNQKFITLNTNQCQGHIINTNRIIEVEPIILVKVSYKNMGNPNFSNLPINEVSEWGYWFYRNGNKLEFTDTVASKDNDQTFSIKNNKFLEN